MFSFTREVGSLVAARKQALLLEALEDRTVPATFTVTPGHAPDDTIQHTINAAESASGANTVVVPSGTYNEALVINDTNGSLTLQPASGASVTLKAPSTTPPDAFGVAALGWAMIDIYSTNVTINGNASNGTGSLTVDVANNTANAGIRVINGGSATIENLSVTGLGNPKNLQSGNGIQVGTINLPNQSATATVTGDTVTKFAGAGVLVAGAGTSATVSGNTVTGVGGSSGVVEYGIQVSDAASASVTGNTVTNNTRTDSGGAVYSAGILVANYSASSSQTSTVSIGGNTVNNNLVGIFVFDASLNASSSISVSGNTVSGSSGYAGIDVANSNSSTASSNIQVTGNTVNQNLAQNGIALSNATGVTVSGNTANSNKNADGIYVFQGSGNTISGNTTDNDGFDGIYLQNSSNNALSGNTADNDGGNRNAGIFDNGIIIQGGTGNSISGSTTSNDNGSGIYLLNTSGVAISNVTSTGNGGYGIRQSTAGSYTLTGNNTISNNSLGNFFTG
jgi:parallel beta-helix repeat protein